MTIDQGIHFDMASADYFADPCAEPSLTQSLIKVLLERSPAHARLAHPRLAPPAADDEPAEKYVAAQAIGNAAHALMIGRGKEIAECQFDSWRSDKAKIARSEAEAAGKTPILTHHYARAVAMVQAGRAQLAAIGIQAFVGDGKGETVIAWQEDGLWFRTMIDWFQSEAVLYDYKTSGMSVAPHNIPRLMGDAGWDIQAAMQERGLNAVDPAGAGRREFLFVAQEQQPPYALTVCRLPESVMTMGRKKVAMAIDIWSRCMRTGEWPAYPAEILTPELPGWSETRWLDREIEHEERASRPRMLTSLMGG